MNEMPTPATEIHVAEAIDLAKADGLTPVADTIRRLAFERDRMKDEIANLRRYVKEGGTTCYMCETCGHGRTTKECLWCERERYKAALENIRRHVEISGGTMAPQSSVWRIANKALGKETK